MTSGEVTGGRAEAALDSSVCWCTRDSTCARLHARYGVCLDASKKSADLG